MLGRFFLKAGAERESKLAEKGTTHWTNRNPSIEQAPSEAAMIDPEQVERTGGAYI